MARDDITRAWRESSVLQRYEQVRATAHSLATRDLALLIVRICLAWIFVYHGASTLFGAFGGAGIHNEAVYYATVAHLHPGTFFAVLGGIIECFGGAAVGLGVFGRLAAAGLAGDMVMAMITVTFSQGLAGNAHGIGYQLNLALVGLAFVVCLLGTGRLSLDYAVRTWYAKSRATRTSPSVATAPH
ncbi:MAG: DoxX [Acidimicrobiaceae bacterium]|nr:DoxX [Acidimicrobiaceae bacterium]